MAYLLLLPVGWLMFTLGFFTAALLTASKRSVMAGGENDRGRGNGTGEESA